MMSSTGLPFLKTLIGGILRPSPKTVLAPVGSDPGQRPAGIHLVAEHARPPDELAVEEDRDQHQPVVDVGDRPAALVGVAREDDVALFDGVVPGLHHLVDVGAELPDDHPALGVGDHGELVVLLPDDRAHGGSEEHRVHLVASVLERSLDDVEGDGVDLDRSESRQS